MPSFPFFRDPIELGPPIVLRHAPLRGDRTLLFQLEQYRIESALIDGEEIIACLFDALRDAVAVLWSEHLQRFQHHQGQRALPHISLFFHCRFGFPHEDSLALVGKQQENLDIEVNDQLGIERPPEAVGQGGRHRPPCICWIYSI